MACKLNCVGVSAEPPAPDLSQHIILMPELYYHHLSLRKISCITNAADIPQPHHPMSTSRFNIQNEDEWDRIQSNQAISIATLSSIINGQNHCNAQDKTHIQVMIDSSPWYHPLNKRTLTQVTYTLKQYNHC